MTQETSIENERKVRGGSANGCVQNGKAETVKTTNARAGQNVAQSKSNVERLIQAEADIQDLRKLLSALSPMIKQHHKYLEEMIPTLNKLLEAHLKVSNADHKGDAQDANPTTGV